MPETRIELGTLGAWAPILALALAAPAPAAESAAQVVTRMIAAHGGMASWSGAETVAFTDEYRPGDAGEGLPSRVVVHQRSRRAYIDYLGTPMRMAWDGERAWSENWQSPLPPRFLALLNYYFAGLPWLTQDPGVVLGSPGRGRVPEDPTDYITIMMTFAPGTGDTPDDYYKLFIDPETYELAANEYIVTYRDVLPEGVAHTPPHILVYDEWTEVGGLKLPAHYTIYEDGAVYGSCAFRDWSLVEPFDESRMSMPDGAVVDESLP